MVPSSISAGGRIFTIHCTQPSIINSHCPNMTVTVEKDGKIMSSIHSETLFVKKQAGISLCEFNKIFKKEQESKALESSVEFSVLLV